MVLKTITASELCVGDVPDLLAKGGPLLSCEAFSKITTITEAENCTYDNVKMFKAPRFDIQGKAPCKGSKTICAYQTK